MTYYEWTAERVAELVRLNLAGSTGGQIAKAMGVTRNTVIGKLHRMKAAGGSGEAAGQMTRRRERIALHTEETMRRNGRGWVGKVQGPEAITFEDSRTVTSRDLLSIGRNQCRYPVAGEREHIWFCAARVEQEGDSYCRQHRVVCYNPTGSARELERGLRRWTA